MSNYFVEVQTRTHTGFHHHGNGMPGDPFHIVGRQHALSMSREFAERRVEQYRKIGNRARIVDVDGRIILDWADSLTESQVIDRYNQHKLHLYRNLFILEDRATKRFHHKFAWPVESGPERSVSGSSCEDVVARLQEMPGDIPQYLAANLDQEELLPPAPADAGPVPAGTPMITIPAIAGTTIVGIRPGSIR